MKIELVTKEDLQNVESKLEKIIQMGTSTYSGELKIYNTYQLSEKLQVSTKTIQNWRERRLIEYSQVNNKIFYTENAIAAFLSAHSIKRFPTGKF